MIANKRYVLDANVFIEAHQKYYSFGICPGFWKALVHQHTRGRVVSIDRVQAELTDIDPDLTETRDILKDWAENKAPRGFFKQTKDQEVIDMFGVIVNSIDSEPQFSPAAKTEFLTVADGWVIAFAKVNGLIVVTHEGYAPNVKKRVPIPNVCRKFGVKYANTFEMLDDLKVKFILSTKRPRRK